MDGDDDDDDDDDDFVGEWQGRLIERHKIGKRTGKGKGKGKKTYHVIHLVDTNEAGCELELIMVS